MKASSNYRTIMPTDWKYLHMQRQHAGVVYRQRGDAHTAASLPLVAVALLGFISALLYNTTETGPSAPVPDKQSHCRHQFTSACSARLIRPCPDGIGRSVTCCSWGVDVRHCGCVKVEDVQAVRDHVRHEGQNAVARCRTVCHLHPPKDTVRR